MSQDQDGNGEDEPSIMVSAHGFCCVGWHGDDWAPLPGLKTAILRGWIFV